MTLTKPVLKSFVKLDFPESKTTGSTQNVAIDALSGRAAPHGGVDKNGEKVVARQCWAWTDRGGYDWMNEHWPFTNND